MTEMTAIYGTGVNEITDAILATLEKREQLKRNFHRCLEVDLCPKCGDNLVIKFLPDSMGAAYKCVKCHFQYAKPKS